MVHSGASASIPTAPRSKSRARRPSSRKYTLAEIDQMRRDIEWSYPSGVSYYPDARSAEIERRLQTYMANGTTPGEVRRMREEAMAVDMARHEAEQAYWTEQAAKKSAEKPAAPKPPVQPLRRSWWYRLLSYLLARAA